MEISTQHWRNDNDRGDRSTWGKTYTSATLSSTNPTLTDLG